MAVDMFLKIEGIKGNREGAIEVLSFSWGLSQPGATAPGGGGGAGKVNVHDISITKAVEVSSAELMQACCSGQHFKKAELSVRSADKKEQTFYIIKLSDCLISSYQIGGSQGDALPMEQVSLNFAKVTLSYAGPDGSATADCGGDGSV
jgi:type VI secretion system secreted protein Hcp